MFFPSLINKIRDLEQKSKENESKIAVLEEEIVRLKHPPRHKKGDKNKNLVCYKISCNIFHSRTFNEIVYTYDFVNSKTGEIETKHDFIYF
jgi:hypothetical protein